MAICWYHYSTQIQARHTHIVMSLDKALYDYYLCLVALNEQQIKINTERVKISGFYGAL